MARKFAVIGVGHFGYQLVKELSEQGAEVLAIDDNIEKLDEVKDLATHTVCLDATNKKALSAQTIEEFDAVIVAMRESFEIALLIITYLQQLNAKRIIAVAKTTIHELIFEHLGIKEVIVPAVEAAERLATSLMIEGALDTFALSTDYKILELTAPEGLITKNLQELELTRRFRVTIITIKRTEYKKRFLGAGTQPVVRIIGIPTPETTIERGDVLVVFGEKASLDKLSKE